MPVTPAVFSSLSPLAVPLLLKPRYVAALLPGHREPTPILRLRYQGSADHWAIGIYKASTGQYSETELPGSFGPATGTPEQGVNDTFTLYAGPRTES